MRLLVTELIFKRYEPECSTCGRKAEVGDIVERKRSRSLTLYFCMNCVKKWG